MRVRFGLKLVTVEPIEWASRDRKKIVAFMIRCPGCKSNRWGRKTDLYLAADGSNNNFKCKNCGYGRPRMRFWNDPKPKLKPKVVVVVKDLEFKHSFAPKGLGWRNLSSFVYTPGPSAGILDPLRENPDVQ